MRLILLKTLTALLFTFSFVSTVFAQTTPPCGNFIAPENFYFTGSEYQADPISNCDNPFDKTKDLTDLTIEGNNVVGEGTYIISATGTTNYKIGDENYYYKSGASFYKHDNQDLILVKTDFINPTQSEKDELISDFFNNNQLQISRYREIYLSTSLYPYFYQNGEYIIDSYADDTVLNVYNDMVNYIKTNIKVNRQPLLPGTYTAVLFSGGPVQSFNYKNNSFLNKIFTTLVPTAYAFGDVSVVTFTLTDKPAEPTGASSVLFLPGIQASRLYSGTDLPGVTSLERVWEPGNNSDVRALEMTGQGISINNLYTKDILYTTTIDLLFGYQVKFGDIYKNFSESLDNLVSDNKIKAWKPYAYDWRYDVFDMVRDGAKINEFGDKELLFNIVKNLAEDSYTKKVTIVAHSNGGLLAKALMIQLKTLGREDLVDKIIFVGTPHLGTPKAIGTILHGFDQEHGLGFVSDSKVVRKIINNLPGAYSLLPSKKYLETVNDAPIISYSGGQITSNFAQYKDFLVGDSSQPDNLDKSIKLPARANSLLLDKALSNHADMLDSWVAPSTTKVSTIIGTGLPTIKGIFYQNVYEDVCQNNQTTTTLCPTVSEDTPMALLSKYGDGTVMAQSARESGSGNRYYLDLAGVDLNNLKIGLPRVDHSNITETSYVQNLIKNIILATTTVPDSQFITTLTPEFVGKYTIQKIASPVQIYSTDSQGNVSGVVRTSSSTWALKLDIPGSEYFEFAGVRYLVTPSDVDITSTLQGEGNGGYSLFIDTIDGNDKQSTIHTIQNATVTPQMIVTYSKVGEVYSTIKTDLNGDGNIDAETTIDGLALKYTYIDLKTEVKALKLPRLQDILIMQVISLAEQANKQKSKYPIFKQLEKILLKQTSDLLEQFKKKKLITQSQVDTINTKINNIVSN